MYKKKNNNRIILLWKIKFSYFLSVRILIFKIFSNGNNYSRHHITKKYYFFLDILKLLSLH